MERINDNVLRMGTSIVNWYLVADDEGVTVVDAAFPAYGSQLGDGLRELGRSQRDIKAIALTHAHADHVGFAEQLRRKLDIPVYIHRERGGASGQPAARSAHGRLDGSVLPLPALLYADYETYLRTDLRGWGEGVQAPKRAGCSIRQRCTHSGIAIWRERSCGRSARSLLR